MPISPRIKKGVILAAGAGTRLTPATFPISKILLPVYDRPMIYYPLSSLISAGIRDILVITNESDLQNFKRAIGDGSRFGVKITYIIQYVQRGISDAFLIGKDFINGDPCVLILGDNIFCGDDIEKLMNEAACDTDNATVFVRYVNNPQDFGVAEFDSEGKVISLEEKPKHPKSNYAVAGMYFLPGDTYEKASVLKPSKRGELEITDLNALYLNEGRLRVKIIDDSSSWIDAGSFDSLLGASRFISETEKKLGTKVLCPETEALKKGFVTPDSVIEWANSNKDNSYFTKIKEFAEKMKKS
ncbi:MAG: NTP transferase domain-containing protein [Candidatus Methanomethylophilaceae archaeon]|nr:NTP transferase domain-containing protein [Candidatus Methanomethylophilaceae archaeon]